MCEEKEEEDDNEKEEACTSVFFNVPNFVSSLFCTAISEKDSERVAEGVADILNLFLTLLLLLNN